jgi:hypothetical protein
MNTVNGNLQRHSKTFFAFNYLYLCLTTLPMILIQKQIFITQSLRILTLIAAFALPAHAQILTDSNLPIVVINTDGGAAIPDEPKILANMKIIFKGAGQRNSLLDINTPSALNYNGRIGIEVRGSSSQALDKKQYGFETRMADNVTNNNVSLLGMPMENDWVLNGLAFDPSLLRDYISYNLARALGDYAPRTQYCEVVINGDYRGLYILEEKIKADANRVDVTKLDKTDIVLPQLSGGYITKADKVAGKDVPAWTMSSYLGTNDVSFIHSEPKPSDVTPEQNNYIQSQFFKLSNQSFDHSIVNGYPALIDVPSFINYMLLSELSGNVDSYQFSTYFHKDRNGKLRAGPLWDYNLTYGNDLIFWGFINRSRTDTWQFDNGDNVGARFWKDLFNEMAFHCYLTKRWNELIQSGKPLNATSINTLIDTTFTNISEAAAREQTRWASEWATLWSSPVNYALEISTIKNFISSRISWMTQNLGSYSSCSQAQTPPLVITKINYNPQTSTQFPDSNDQEFIEIVNNGNDAVDLTGFYFQGTGLVYQFPANTTINAHGILQLASKRETFQLRYGHSPFDEYTRHLANEEQRIILSDAFGNIIDEVDYSSAAPWPDATANGKYLILKDIALDNSLASSWTTSSDPLEASVLTAITDGNENLQYFPNPVERNLEIRSNNLIHTVQIEDMQGKILNTIQPNEYTLSIDMSGFSGGIYILTIASENRMEHIKVVKR